MTSDEYIDLNNKLIKLETSLNNIDNKLNILLNITDKFDDIVHDIHQSTSNMDNHITFVETIYDTISSPLYYIMNKFSKVKLQEIQYKNSQLKLNN